MQTGYLLFLFFTLKALKCKKKKKSGEQDKMILKVFVSVKQVSEYIYLMILIIPGVRDPTRRSSECVRPVFLLLIAFPRSLSQLQKSVISTSIT